MGYCAHLIPIFRYLALIWDTESPGQKDFKADTYNFDILAIFRPRVHGHIFTNNYLHLQKHNDGQGYICYNSSSIPGSLLWSVIYWENPYSQVSCSTDSKLLIVSLILK